MMQTPHAEHQRSSRTPYIGAALFFLVLLTVGVLTLMPKLQHRNELRVEAQEAVGPPVVLATKLKSGEAGGHLEIAASVQAFDQTPVFARTSGYVKSRYVDIGDHVRHGRCA